MENIRSPANVAIISRRSVYTGGLYSRLYIYSLPTHSHLEVVFPGKPLSGQLVSFSLTFLLHLLLLFHDIIHFVQL